MATLRRWDSNLPVKNEVVSQLVELRKAATEYANRDEPLERSAAWEKGELPETYPSAL